MSPILYRAHFFLGLFNPLDVQNSTVIFYQTSYSAYYYNFTKKDREIAYCK